MVPILTKDEEKQRLIKEKAKADAEAKEARAIGPSNPTQASRGVVAGATKMADRKPVTVALAGKGGAGAAAAAATNGVYGKQPTVNASATPAAASKTQTPAAGAASAGSKKISMVIPAIPPFKGGAQAKPAPPVAPPVAPVAPVAATPASNGPAKIPIPPLAPIPPFKHNNGNNRASPSGNNAPPMSPNSAANRLNVNASSFRPNPKANAFTPVIIMHLLLTFEHHLIAFLFIVVWSYLGLTLAEECTPDRLWYQQL